MLLINQRTGEQKEYIGELKSVDKTRLMRASEQVAVCNTYYSNANCHYKYTKVGFEFRIPTSDLEVDSEYDLKLRIYEKQVQRGLQLYIYVMGIDDSAEKDGVRYQLYSDINKTNVRIIANSLFVRSGPGQNYSIRSANFSCSLNGKTLFWYPHGYFSQIKGASQNNPGNISSELWVNMGYDLGSCVDGKARAVNGNTFDGWAPWVFMIGSGTPATIKTLSLDTISIDELRAYTSEANTNTKVLLTLTSSMNQNITIKAYHNNSLVYKSNKYINGTKSFNINYRIPNSGILKIEITNQYKTINISSNIYVSSKKEYVIPSTESTGLITVETPILVVTDKYRNIKEYKEKIQLSTLPYKAEISQGRGINGLTSAILYWYPLEEFYLNSDYSIYALYPSQENTMNYEMMNGKVKVNLLKDTIKRNDNHDISYFYHPNILLSVIEGNLYNQAIDGYYYFNEGQIWYPSWNENLGKYEYMYVGSNLGINKVTIKRNLSYIINSKMFGNDNGKFAIKRIEPPDSLNIIYKKKFTYDELKEYLGAR